ncbi:MAG: cell wall metabolism sensor histidine kinase WalK [Thermomicrobiales bacterium]|nr:cell wall metabolism sensor histidine kinase WalK [Thermomicrobiales bacterium]
MPTDTDSIYDLATALLATTSVDDVLAIAPPLLACALGLQTPPQIDLDTSTRPNAGQIALIADGSHIGSLTIAGGDTPDPQHAAAIANLLATTIAAHRRTLADTERQIQEASALKLDLVSMLSHEMRTPLASIKGFASALRIEGAGWDGATRDEFLRTIEDEADHMTRLVEDILESAAIDAGLLRVTIRPIQIPPIARRVIDRISIQSDRHRFVQMFSNTFPIVEADAGRIEQVLTNLIDNAVKYSPDGGLIVVRGERRASEVIISVVDQGMGIAPEHLNKLFERFYRASPEHRQHIIGTGLGLPISESIVRAHGGRIWAESVVGSGTTLSFTLPIHSAAAAGTGNA